MLQARKYVLKTNTFHQFFLFRGTPLVLLIIKPDQKKELQILSLNTKFGLVAVSILLLQNE